MRYRHLFITITVGMVCLLALVGAMDWTPALYAAAPVAIEQVAMQQPAQTQGVLAELVVTPTKDNTLYESATGALSNGAGDYFFAGSTNRGDIRRGLVAFDLAGKLPVNATIVSATLQLHMSKSLGGQQAASLHRVTADWGQGSSNANSNEGGGAPAATGDATWLHTFSSTTLWQTPGGDFASTATATTTVAGEAFYRWSSPGLIADVQQWLTNPASNFGWALVGNEAESGTAQRFDTRENPVAANRPQLIIVYNTGTDETVKLYLPLIRK